MAFENIHLIHPITSAAEEEYTKKFLRFIGNQVYGRPVNEQISQEWNRQLVSVNEEGGVDVIMNYYGEDMYFADSFRRGVRRIYFYFDLENGFCEAREIAVKNPSPVKTSKEKEDQTRGEKSEIRRTALESLIRTIWKNDTEAQNSILKIYELYFDIKEDGTDDDLFFLLQAKRCLRVMTMGEVLNDPGAYIQYIPPYDYICHILERLSEIYFSEQLCRDHSIYSLYARINTAVTMFTIVEKIYPHSRTRLEVRLVPTDDAFLLLEELLDILPTSISAVLLYARFSKYSQELHRIDESIYRYLQKLVPENRADYAYIWYRIGRYYEKRKHDKTLALTYYQKAVRADPDCYQAVFKLGYFAALDFRYKEAEIRLNEVVKIMFHGNDMGPGNWDTYPNWDYLSSKDCQYAYKAYVMLAKIAVNGEREYSTRAYIGSACLAATRFEESRLEKKLCDQDENGEVVKPQKEYFYYHRYSTPVWSMWKVLQPWSEQIIRDDFVRQIVQDHLAQWV